MVEKAIKKNVIVEIVEQNMYHIFTNEKERKQSEINKRASIALKVRVIDAKWCADVQDEGR